MRSPSKKRIRRVPLNPDVKMCEYHPNRPAVTAVALSGEILFDICGECKKTLTKVG